MDDFIRLREINMSDSQTTALQRLLAACDKIISREVPSIHNDVAYGRIDAAKELRACIEQELADE
jgi:hypothetical protein